MVFDSIPSPGQVGFITARIAARNLKTRAFIYMGSRWNPDGYVRLNDYLVSSSIRFRFIIRSYASCELRLHLLGRPVPSPGFEVARLHLNRNLGSGQAPVASAVTGIVIGNVTSNPVVDPIEYLTRRSQIATTPTSAGTSIAIFAGKTTPLRWYQVKLRIMNVTGLSRILVIVEGIERNRYESRAAGLSIRRTLGGVVL